MTDHVCCYCGRKANFQFKNKKWCCSSSMNKCPEIIKRRKEDAEKQWKLRRDLGFNESTASYADMNIRPNIISKFDGIHCEYGCGNEAKYILKNGKHCCSNIPNKCPEIRKKNSEKVKLAHDKKKQDTGSASFWNHTYDEFPQEIKDRMTWCKGLTKDTDFRLKKMADKISKTMINFYQNGGTHFTEESRKKLSSSMKQYMLEHPERHPNRTFWNTKQHMTYPEQLVYGWLLESGLPFESQYPWKYTQNDGSVHMRYVDFCILDRKVFIEIDGNYWHESRKDIDSTKDRCAEIDGYKTYRLNPAKKILNQLSKIPELKMNNCQNREIADSEVSKLLSKNEFDQHF